MTTDRKELIRRLNAAFSGNDLETVAALCTGDVRWNMVGQTRIEGRQALEEFLSANSGTVPVISVQDILVDGDAACCTGEMEMSDAPGEAAKRYAFCDTYRFEGDRIAELQSFIIEVSAES